MKIDVVNIITAPEIEILVIIKEGKYQSFKKSNLKPSDYCKQILKMSDVKSYNSVIDYFSDVDSLLDAMQQYKQVSNLPKGELSLIDLLADKN